MLKDPSLLAALFTDSVDAFGDYDNAREPFHPVRRGKPPNQRSHTAVFAASLKTQPRAVTGHPDLDFLYVDRELVPTRAVGGGRGGERLDLLLRNTGDGTPIVAEVKVGRDKTPFAALIQALALAALMVTPAQRRRTAAHYPRAGLRWPASGPVIDVYLILLDGPRTFRYWGDLLTAADELAGSLTGDSPASQLLRRIVCLTGSLTGDSLSVQFAHGAGL